MPDGTEGEDQAILAPAGDISIPPGPPPSSDAPGDSTDPQPESTTGAQDEEAREPVPEFDPRWREDFEGLLYLGYLTKDFSWAGHRFSMRTLDVDTILEIGLLHRDYQGTLSDLKAYQALVIAAALTMVDGRPVALPLSDSQSDLEAKFVVVTKWYPHVHDYLYSEYLTLEDRVAKVLDAMGEASGSMGSTPGLSPASV